MRLTNILIATTIMLGVAGAVIPNHKIQMRLTAGQVAAEECCSDPICLPGDAPPCPQNGQRK